MNIVNKTVLVSGASDGIGRSIAIALAESGANLILLGRDVNRLGLVQKICESKGVDVRTYAFDITNNESLEHAVASMRQSGTIDVIINNAGVWHKSSSVEELEPELVQTVIATNLTAHILLVRLLIDDMKDRETAIINMISSAGMQGKGGHAAYAASKFGMRGFTESLRDEMYANQIRIGAVFQGGTNTQMFEKAGENMHIEKYTEPDDLAQVVLFMLTRPKKLWLNEVHVTY